jgi:hypothetical protein
MVFFHSILSRIKKEAINLFVDFSEKNKRKENSYGEYARSVLPNCQ